MWQSQVWNHLLIRSLAVVIVKYLLKSLSLQSLSVKKVNQAVNKIQWTLRRLSKTNIPQIRHHQRVHPTQICPLKWFICHQSWLKTVCSLLLNHFGKMRFKEVRDIVHQNVLRVINQCQKLLKLISYQKKQKRKHWKSVKVEILSRKKKN